MQISLILKILKGKTTFIVGNSKGAGKTTFLNFASKCVRPICSPVLATIGIDGEKYDSVLYTPKPQILTEPNDHIITTDKMLNSSHGRFQIIEVFPFKTVLGRLLLAKTIRQGYIELVGPENNEQLSTILNYVQNKKELGTVIIDGSINRLTQVSTSSKASFIYVFRITKSNFKSSIQKMRAIQLLNGIKKFDEKNKTDVVIFNGAFTKSKMMSLELDNKSLVLEDFTRLFIDYDEIKKLMETRTVYFRTIFKLECFVVNLVDINDSDFEKELDNNIKKLVIYNPYGA